MSFDALAWAAKCRPGSPAKKLVLFALAECAQRDGSRSFPSVPALVEFTSLNRKTIIVALAQLQAQNLISDTGERVGRTKQIRVFQLHIETVPKAEQSQKRNSPVFSRKASQKRDTDTLREPVSSDATHPQISARMPKPVDVSEQTWVDFLKLRKAKRAPVSETVIDGIRDEAADVGWSIEMALRKMVQRGWQGFEAKWITENGNGNARKQFGNSTMGQLLGEVLAER